jgi:Ca-activated chloride channel family protein
MNYLLQWQQITYLYWLLPLLALVVCARMFWYKPMRYVFSLVQAALSHDAQSKSRYATYLTFLRAVTLLVLVLLIAQPRIVDVNSKLPVEGIAIMLVLDVSGSMHNKDDETDYRTRLDVAKQEAIRFVQKRDNDAIGLVLFAKDALSRLPLTMDKELLTKVIDEIELGFIDPDGTALFTGMTTALNRLRYAHAKSKIMILLTDGEPSEGDMNPRVPIEIAQQLGIKIYTIGIGSDGPRYVQSMMGVFAIPGVNKQLLTEIAQATGGKFFLARNPSDMRTIYDTIDALERSEHELPSFSRWYEIASSAIWFVLALLAIELILATFVWFSVCL